MSQTNPTGALGASAILLIGDEGTGKTSSFETLPPDKTVIIQPNTKDLPWGGYQKKWILQDNLLRVSTLSQTLEVLNLLPGKYPNLEYVVVEDTTHLQNERTTSQVFIAMNSGNAAFSKWNQFGADFSKMISEPLKKMPAHVVVIFVGHTEMKDDGMVTLQTAGKLLDNSFKVPSYFTYMLHSRVIKKSDGEGVDYYFQTNADGMHKAKTPRGCFAALYIPNDMKAVVDRIKAFKAGN